MRLLAINQYYYPDHSATSQLLTQLCEDLVSEGDHVTVLASRGGYLGGGGHAAREEVRGVEIIRPWATRWGKASVARRLSDYTTFWASSVVAATCVARPDVILSLTTPPMIAAGAALVSAARRIPLVTWVQDVYPEVAIAFGLLNEGDLPARSLRALNRVTYRRASRIVVLSDRMAERVVVQGQATDRVAVIPNWADGQHLRPSEAERSRFRSKMNLHGRFVVMYSGNLGQGHDVATLVQAARLVERDDPNVQFLFVGEGSRRQEAEALAHGLGNVSFQPYQPYEDLADSLSAADVHLASLRPELDGLLVPSKLYGVMAVGRPLLFIGPARSEVARFIEEHGVGWAGRPGDAAGLAAAIERYARHPERVGEQGRRAREVFEREIDRRHAVRRWREILLQVARNGSRTG